MAETPAPVPDADLAALAARPFRLDRPQVQTAPFIFASPHSGRRYPQSLVSASRLDPLMLRRSEDAFVDELFLLPEARGQGLGEAALDHLARELAGRGVVALHLEVGRGNAEAQRFYRRKGFEMRDGYFLMTRRL